MRAKLLSVAILLAFAPAFADTQAPQDWIARSNRDAQPLLQAQADFAPERASSIGLAGYDDKVADLGPRYGERSRAASARARKQLQDELAKETDPNVRQDLQIMIDSTARAIEGSELDERLMLDWTDEPELVFGGERTLLQEQASPEKRAHAIVRLRNYLGLAPGTTSIFEQAKARYVDSLA